jgi:hypothetical protein
MERMEIRGMGKMRYSLFVPKKQPNQKGMQEKIKS